MFSDIFLRREAPVSPPPPPPSPTPSGFHSAAESTSKKSNGIESRFCPLSRVSFFPLLFPSFAHPSSSDFSLLRKIMNYSLLYKNNNNNNRFVPRRFDFYDSARHFLHDDERDSCRAFAGPLMGERFPSGLKVRVRKKRAIFLRR